MVQFLGIEKLLENHLLPHDPENSLVILDDKLKKKTQMRNNAQSSDAGSDSTFPLQNKFNTKLINNCSNLMDVTFLLNVTLTCDFYWREKNKLYSENSIVPLLKEKSLECKK